ncbi:MAG: ABC transporter substrate-binding protein [Acidobacteria bacterium]|nr:ABC transporter substrate-binding protein [Acidobacteriota bacterium]
MKSPFFRRVLLMALVAAIVISAACRSRNPPAYSGKAGKRGGSLRYRVASPPQTFNYLQAADDSSIMVAFYLMGGRLVEFDHDTRTYVPGVAETWKLNDDGRSVEVALRDGIKFSDGRPITTRDVVFTLRALYDKRTAAPIFRDAMLINGRQIEAAIIDSRKLKLIFPEAIAAPEGYLSNLAVLPAHVLEADFNRGALRDTYSLNADPQQIVTAGAFTAGAVVPGERVLLKRNPHYWKKDAEGTSLPYLDELLIEVAADANNALARLKQGTLDIFDRIRPNDYAALRSETQTLRALDLGPGLNTDHLWFNLNTGEQSGKPVVNPIKRAWFNDLRFRRALSHAIDRETIAGVTLQGLATPLYGLVSPCNRTWAADGLTQPKYDLERARELLREANFAIRGAPDRPELYDAKGNRVELTLIVPTESQPRVKMATVVQEDWAKLGIKLQVAPIEFGELRGRIEQSYQYDAALVGAVVSEPDPSSYVNLLQSSSPTHQWHPKQLKPATVWEARIDELLVAQARETNQERRAALFREVQSILAEQVPLIPIVARHIAIAGNQKIGNHRPSPLLPYSLWNAQELFMRE